ILVMYLGRIVESGSAGELFAAPSHPYTQALLSALPKPGSGRERRVRVDLPGEPRSPIDPDPNICPLYGRCDHATDQCRRAMPPVREIVPARLGAGHYPITKPAGADAKLQALPATA